MLKLLLAAAVACPRAVAINSKGAPSYEAKMNLFSKNNRGESCASDEGLSDLDQQLLYAANTGNDKIVEVCLADGANPNAVVNGVSALMHAAQHGHLVVVDRLLYRAGSGTAVLPFVGPRAQKPSKAVTVGGEVARGHCFENREARWMRFPARITARANLA